MEELGNQNRASQSQVDAANRLLDEGFDHLRDIGHNVTESVESELSNVAIEYGINIDSPEDMEKVWKLYDKIRKTGGAGKSARAETV